MSVLSSILDEVGNLIGMPSGHGQPTPAIPLAQPSLPGAPETPNLIKKPVNNHSTSNQLLALLAGGPAGFARQRMAQNQQKVLAGVIQGSIVDGQFSPDAYVRNAAEAGLAVSPDDIVKLQQAAALAAARRAKSRVDLGPNHKYIDADTGSVLTDNAEPYTLAPGSKRFGPDDHEVAAAPFAPHYDTVGEGQKLVRTDDGAPSAGPAVDFRGIVQGVVGAGGKINSGYRTPEQQAALRAAGKTQTTNSHHMEGDAANPGAYDLAPPPGVSTAQLAQHLIDQGFPRDKVLDEHSHVHVTIPAGGQPHSGGGSRVIAEGNPKVAPGKARPATVEEKAAYGINPDVPAQMKPDGTIDVISGIGTNMKPVPQTILRYVSDTRAAIRNIDEAIAAVKENPYAIGVQRVGPDILNQTVDPGGVSVRAKVANIGSQVRHDRSGAAVTAAETPYLKPFIPSTHDRASTALVKLQEMRKRYTNELEAVSSEFNPDSGYRSLDHNGAPQAGPGPGQPQPSAAPAMTQKDTIAQAKAAIKAGADPDKVAARLHQMGIDPAHAFAEF